MQHASLFALARTGATLLPLLLGASPSASEVLYGFTAFPHDFTAEAVDQVHERILPNETLYAQHMDQCLPWHEALDDTAFPDWLRGDLDEIRSRKLPGQVLYVAMTPSANDRRSLAPACGAEEGEERDLPSSLEGASFASAELQRAYVNYVRRIVDELQPQYINIGIEMSELALQHPEEWPAFEALFRHTVDALRASHPNVKVGLELVLQSIMKPEVTALVRPAAEYGDYVGISFYPYGSAFGETLGAPALAAAAPAQWQQPLEFLRTWTRKPIAIAETGYTTETVSISAGFFSKIEFPGTAALQQEFLTDLIDEAVHSDYLFVVWFVPIDYPKLLAKLEDMGVGAEWMKIWSFAGLFDQDLQPKPAFDLWARWRQQAEMKNAPRRF